MNKPLTEEDIMSMSDDDIMDVVSLPGEQASFEEPEQKSSTEGEPVIEAQDAEPEDEHDPEDDQVDASSGAPVAPDAGDGVDAEAAEADKADEPNALAGPDEDVDAETAPKPDPKAKDPETKKAADPADEDNSEVKSAEDESKKIDYKAAYEKVMAPFKAAGKQIELKDPEEAVRLMQMGAHYTKKMQALQPGLKVLKMLEKNQLLDESKLSYLIDIHRKDPAAIQKLVRDSGLDPMDIDTSVEPSYKPGNHKISDAEMEFNTTLEDVASDPEGKNLIVDINDNWDQTSVDVIVKDPSVLRVLAEQKNNGIFDKIQTEIERRRTLGYLRNEPFLHAYKSVGEEMQQQGLLTHQPTEPAPTPTPPANGDPAADTRDQPRRVVETRTPQRKTDSNAAKAKAASAPRGSTKPAPQDFNPLALSDEDFAKQVDIGRSL